jgi:hypothetical protein
MHAGSVTGLPFVTGWQRPSMARLRDTWRCSASAAIAASTSSTEIGSSAALVAWASASMAAGENHYTKWEFKELLEKGGVRIVQADVVRCGGLTEFLKIAALADAYGLPVCPHNGPRVTIVVAFIEPRTPGAAMKEISGPIWTDIQGPCGCPVAAARGRRAPAWFPFEWTALRVLAADADHALAPPTGVARVAASTGAVAHSRAEASFLFHRVQPRVIPNWKQTAVCYP